MTHADEARRLIESLKPLEGQNADFDLELAQAHALLEIAEQQRISNLIAITTLSFGTGSADVTKPWESINDTPEWESVRAEIAAALKIGDQA